MSVKCRTENCKHSTVPETSRCTCEWAFVSKMDDFLNISHKPKCSTENGQRPSAAQTGSDIFCSQYAGHREISTKVTMDEMMWSIETHSNLQSWKVTWQHVRASKLAWAYLATHNGCASTATPSKTQLVNKLVSDHMRQLWCWHTCHLSARR